jgi:CheY-like chemotaxis protein
MSNPASVPVHPATILVVEDDELQRLLLVDMLRGRGLTVVEAASAQEALKQLDFNTDIQLIFTDIQLSGEIDGLDLLRVVNVRWPHVSMLSTSGQIRPHFGEMPINARFLPKPFLLCEVVRYLDELLGIEPNP